ncbi:hypothetical protein M9Y10_015955 [Tritrichomonas musculus]|uniref:Myb-like DNA-binding domain containing protein n=1 Tax=Tritrichomonas musculus TaxID=1915356 RepID=A0ABR2I5A4_9EUKA
MNLNSQQNYNQIPEIPRSIIINSYINGVSRRRNFAKEEDKRLSYLVEQYGTSNWELIASMMPLRNARQCRDRFRNYLSPKINLKKWTKEEDTLLISKYNELGPKWVQISQYFDGRSDNNLKNRWYTHLRKKCQETENINTDKPVFNGNPVLICDDMEHLFIDPDNYELLSESLIDVSTFL